jgi:hypothetical protein
MKIISHTLDKYRFETLVFVLDNVTGDIVSVEAAISRFEDTGKKYDQTNVVLTNVLNPGIKNGLEGHFNVIINKYKTDEGVN